MNLNTMKYFIISFFTVVLVLMLMPAGAIAEDSSSGDNVAEAEQQVEELKPVPVSEFEEIVIEENLPEEHLLDLEQSINMALENNSIFNIQKKQTKVYKIKATKSILNFLPSFNTDMTLSYQTDIANIDSDGGMFLPGIGQITFAGFDVEKNWKRQNTVSAIQTVTGMYRKYHLRRIASLNFDKAVLQEDYAADITALGVYDTYFEVLASKYQLEAYKKNVEELQSYYDMAFARYEEGSALKRDAQKVEVELDKAKFQVFVKQNELDDSLNMMKNILGISQNDVLDLNTTYQPLSGQIPLDNAIQSALKNNQQLKQSEIGIKIAEHIKKQEYANYIPDFDIGVTYLNQDGSEFFPKNNFLLSFNMNFKFFDWGQRELTIKERQLELEQAQLAYKDQVEKLIVGVKDKYNNVQEAEMLIKVSENAVDLAKRNLEISTNRYKVGLELITEVLGDQSDLAKARSDYYQALFDQQKAVAQLKQAMGILLSEEKSR